jgi:hypothetical protein
MEDDLFWDRAIRDRLRRYRGEPRPPPLVTSEVTPDALVTGAARLVDAEIRGRQLKFAAVAEQALREAAQVGSRWGSVHRLVILRRCNSELRKRILILVTGILTSHEALSAPPSPTLRAAAKDWVCASSKSMGDDLTQHLWKPRAAFGESEVLDDLHPEMQQEIEAACAEIDNAFDRLQRRPIERARRWMKRGLRRARLRLRFGGRARV